MSQGFKMKKLMTDIEYLNNVINELLKENQYLKDRLATTPNTPNQSNSQTSSN